MHFAHGNICRGTSTWSDKSGCRDFNTVEEHDNTILKNINLAIGLDDIFYVLGDFSVGSSSGSLKMDKIAAYEHYRRKIACNNIIYIRGNHSLSRDKLLKLGIFNEVYDYYELKYKQKLICMFHYPISSWNGMANGSLHTFAHLHSNLVRGRSMDIGLESNNFKPHKLDDVINFLSSQPILSEGHHNENSNR